MFRSIRTKAIAVFGITVFIVVLLSLLIFIALTKTETDISALFLIITITVIISVAISISVAASFASRIIRPVNKITETLQKFSSGDYSYELQINRKDEIGRLADSSSNITTIIKNTMSPPSARPGYLFTIINEINDGILITDIDKRILMINKSAASIFNIDREKAQGRRFIEVFMDHEIESLLNRCLTSKSGYKARIQTSPHKKILEVSVTSMPDKSGCMILLHDLSAIEKSEVSQRDFISNISHELRTPVTSIKVLAETLLQGAMDDSKINTEYLNKIDLEADRLAQLITEISEILKMEGRFAPLKKSPVNVNNLLEDTVNRIKPQALRSGLNLNISTQPNLPEINADSEKIEQVLINIIHNAIKFTPAGGNITVSARREADSVHFAVIDTGAGIPSDDLPRVFERFYKADKARSGGGTGLGLAIAKQIVEEHGGNIQAESTEGKGSTFHFTIPL